MINAPKEVTSKHGQVLYSEIALELDQLKHTDWTFNFNPYWSDACMAHSAAFRGMYDRGNGGILLGLAKAITLVPDLSGAKEEKAAVEALLTEYQTVLGLAEKVEAVYTQIYDQRFLVEREVWEPYERERILAGLIQLYLDFIPTVPKEYQAKVKRELEYHVFSLRRMIFDAPNVKAQFPILMA